MKTVAFVLDYAMHYHRATLIAIDQRLRAKGGRLVLMTGDHTGGKSGRVPLKDRIVADEHRYPLIEVPIGGFTVRHQRGLVRELRRLRPDVVVTTSHSGTISEWAVMRAKKELGFEHVAWQCGYEYNPGMIKDAVLRRFIHRFDHHLAYHSNARQYALNYGATENQVTVMHNTINEASITCLAKGEAKALVEAKYPQLAGKTVILYVGAVLAEKRLETVFDALHILGNSQVAFLVIGDGPHLAVLQERYGRRADAVFGGRVVDGVGPYFDCADVFVLPGTGGLAINEAMAHGLPVISGYADGSADDLVVDGQNGYRLLTESPQELADRLAQLIADENLRRNMGTVSRELITSKFSFKSFLDRVMSVLEK